MCRSSLGELMHQPVELAAHVLELALDQGEAFGDEPYMRDGGFGRARRQLDGRGPQPSAQRRGIDPADAVLFQHPGQRYLANPLPRARRRKALPQVQRPRRRDVVVNRVEELRVVAPELVPHSVGQANAFPRQFLAQTRPLAQLDDCRVGRLQPPQTVRVGTQRRGEHSRVPPVVLRARRREAVAETVELFRVDRVDGEAALHQAFDHRPAWRLDRHSDFACVSRRERQHPARHLRQPCTAVLELSFSEHLPGSVEHAHLMFLRPPVDPREPSQLQFEPPLCRIEWARPDACRSLYWRSTAQTPHGASIGGWTAGAQVLFRCSLHWGPLGAPGGLPDSARSSREVIRKGTGTP